MIWNVRGMLWTSVGAMTVWIFWPFATRIPSEPSLNPAWSRLVRERRSKLQS
jgi:hypothetical protein